MLRDKETSQSPELEEVSLILGKEYQQFCLRYLKYNVFKQEKGNELHSEVADSAIIYLIKR
jgi:hypothetical protein